MAYNRILTPFQFLDANERAVCVLLNRASHVRAVRSFFAAISRLGDGVFWYVLILAIPIYHGTAALAISAQMVLTGLVGILVYKLLKPRLVRERPCAAHPGIQLGTAPLDRYSFPSGHTLHAVAFTMVAVEHLPELGIVLVPLTLLIALSRVVLGLHYPSDVLAGAAIGAIIARCGFALAAI